MTEYEKLVMVERVAHTVEIVERLTGKVGVCGLAPCNYGNTRFADSPGNSTEPLAG